MINRFEAKEFSFGLSASAWKLPLSRRGFLKVLGIAGASAVVAACATEGQSPLDSTVTVDSVNPVITGKIPQDPDPNNRLPEGRLLFTTLSQAKLGQFDSSSQVPLMPTSHLVSFDHNTGKQTHAWVDPNAVRQNDSTFGVDIKNFPDEIVMVWVGKPGVTDIGEIAKAGFKGSTVEIRTKINSKDLRQGWGQIKLRRATGKVAILNIPGPGVGDEDVSFSISPETVRKLLEIYPDQQDVVDNIDRVDGIIASTPTPAPTEKLSTSRAEVTPSGTRLSETPTPLPPVSSTAGPTGVTVSPANPDLISTLKQVDAGLACASGAFGVGAVLTAIATAIIANRNVRKANEERRTGRTRK